MAVPFVKSGYEAVHSELSASGCYRWSKCAGSVRMERQAPPSATSVYAAEGTAAHALAHACLLNQRDAFSYIDSEIEGHAVDTEMAENVQVYIDLCSEYDSAENIYCLKEHKFTLEKLHPPRPMFGTADFVAFDPVNKALTIIDLKYGKGINVEVVENPQLKYYALGALLSIENYADYKTVETIIVQPRVGAQAIKRYRYAVSDILEWSSVLISLAFATMESDAPLVPGDHCKFCRAGGNCPAQAQRMLAIAQMEFDADLDPPVLQGEPPRIERLTPAEIAALLNKADMLDSFIKGLRAAAQRLIENGETIPGWKVVGRRPTRKWEDPDSTPTLLEFAGLASDEIWTRRITTPKQAEVALTARYRAEGQKAKIASEMAKADLKPLIISVSSGGTLAPESDDRRELPARGQEFEFELVPDASKQAAISSDQSFSFEDDLPNR